MVKGKGVEDEFGQCVNNGKINREQIVKKTQKGLAFLKIVWYNTDTEGGLFPLRN